YVLVSLFFSSIFFFSSRRRHTRSKRDWSSDVCSSDLVSGWRRWPPICRRCWSTITPWYANPPKSCTTRSSPSGAVPRPPPTGTCVTGPVRWSTVTCTYLARSPSTPSLTSRCLWVIRASGRAVGALPRVPGRSCGDRGPTVGAPACQKLSTAHPRLTRSMPVGVPQPLEVARRTLSGGQGLHERQQLPSGDPVDPTQFRHRVGMLIHAKVQVRVRV